jgi:hypothetical protein
VAGYTKLFSTIVTSTIWQEDKETKILWVTMLATADADGRVDGSIPGLAHLAHLTIAECEKALKKLMSPDSYSRSKEFEGRRIKEIDGGWQILNYQKYREKNQTRDKEYFRIKQQKHRQKQRQRINTCKQDVDNVDITNYTLQQVKDACVLNSIPESAAQSYFDNYNSQGWLKANKLPITNLQSHVAKRWSKSKQCWDFDEKKDDKANPNFCYLHKSSGCKEGKNFVWRQSKPFGSVYCYEEWVKKGKPICQ